MSIPVTEHIIHAPKIRQVYWCKFPETEFSNEFGYDQKLRPVVVISKQNRLHGTVVIVPFSTVNQTRTEVSVKLISPILGECSWVVCSHPTTVSTRRLIPDKKLGVVRMEYSVFQRVKDKILSNLPD